MKWTNTFQNTNMKEIVRILEPYKEKVVYIKKKKEIYRIITDLFTRVQTHRSKNQKAYILHYLSKMIVHPFGWAIIFCKCEGLEQGLGSE